MSESLHYRIATGLAKISIAMRHHAWAQGEHTGITPTQAQILTLLSTRDEIGMPVTAIARELAVTQPTISDAVAALVAKRLVSKTRSKEDGRIFLIRLTSRGRQRGTASTLWPDSLTQAIRELDAAERSVFVLALVKMIRALQLSGHIPTARMCTSCTYFRPNQYADERTPHHCTFVDAAFGNAELQIDCGDHQLVHADDRPKLWTLFIEGKPIAGTVPATDDPS